MFLHGRSVLIEFNRDLLGKFTGFVRGIHDLVKEDGVVESQTESDWMRRVHLHLGNIKRSLIRLL